MKRTRRRAARLWFRYGPKVILVVVLVLFGVALAWCVFELLFIVANGHRYGN